MALEHKDPGEVFILSVSSDIGEHLALEYLRRGMRVAGTYRTRLPRSLSGISAFHPMECDLSNPASGAQISSFLAEIKLRWSLFISCVGRLSPVGPFFETDYEDWAHSVEVNSLIQLRALHAAHACRKHGDICHVALFAGGGTNGPFSRYSAYCLGKMVLIKMCELLDDENSDLNPFIIGTGWVRTKIHEQTLAAGERAGENLRKTRAFIENKAAGTSMSDIAAMIDWCIAQGKAICGGRNFSIVHDAWREGGVELSRSLREDHGKFKLCRKGNGPV